MKYKNCVLFVMIMIFALAACGRANTPESSSAHNTGSTSHYPVTVMDQAGRQVVIEKEPQRLLSSYYITSSLLIALDLDDKLVGVEDNAGLRPIYELSSPQILELPNIGTVKELDLEKCASLSPDLAILPMKLKNSVENLEQLGIPVIIVNPESQELLTEMIEVVGIATNTEDVSEQLIQFLADQETYLTKALADVDRPSVYLAGNSGLLSTAGDFMYQSDLIRLAGGKNAASDIEDTYWAEIDYEQLLTWNPEYIILASSAKYSVEDVLNDSVLADCDAIIKKNVFQIPCDAEAWDSPVPGSILGALWLANILHPDLVTDSDCANAMENYYETFYNFKYAAK